MRLDDLLNTPSDHVFFKQADLIPPTVRYLIGAGGGGLIGLLHGATKKKSQFLTEQEKLKRAIAKGVFGSVLGLGIASLPDFIPGGDE